MPKAKAQPKPGTALVTVVAEQPVLRSHKDISKDIAEVIIIDGGFDMKVHALAVECLQHACPPDMGGHGDYSLFAQLIGDVKTAGGATFGKGVRSRRQGLIEWVARFSPIRVNGDGLIGALPTTAKTYVAFNVDAAESSPFYEGSAETARRSKNTPFDVATIMGRLGSFNKAIDNAVENGNLNDDEALLRQFTRALNTYAAQEMARLGLSSDAAKARRAA